MKRVPASEIQKLRSWYHPSDVALAKKNYPILQTLVRPALLFDVGKPQRSLGPLVSKIGGTFGWPESEPHARSKAGLCVPIAQFTKRDFPLLPFPQGRDILQILWHPEDLRHEVDAHKKWISQMDSAECAMVMPPERQPSIYWQKAKALTGVLSPPDVDARRFRGLVPEGSCPLSGRLVDDYPDRLDRYGLNVLERELQSCDNFGQAKVGGHARWTAAGPMKPCCPTCGAEMPPAVSLDPLIHDGNGRWRNPSKLFESFGGRWILFVCEQCPSRPFQAVSRLY